MTIYFAQACGGGPIKIGASRRPDIRKQQLGAWIPQGVELITMIPGYIGREAYLKAALRPWLVYGEWFASSVSIWRLIIAAADDGDVAWIPDMSDSTNQHAEVVQIASELKIKPPPHYGCYGPHIMGKYRFALDLQNRVLPQWVMDAHESISSEAA